jgi:outer membrane protein OmpA-like peptidoglycan-associated protein
MKKVVSTILMLALASLVAAQPMKSATVDQLVDQLAGPDQPKTRSLRNLKPEPRNIDLLIQFDFDSAKLQASSKPLLANLAAAMRADRLMDIRFHVEGHTDAKGTEAYNLNLSQKRADSVVHYLIELGIPSERLASSGKGFSELLFPDQPHAMENRRVRIVTLP